MAMAGPLGVRKGAWTNEEDVLLRKCIQKYGEGNWHLVPLRAGLNRCRKSCRLRWLNYLRPNIKRGEFAFDEADLIIRLRKLLGNRWALIAGRLPGRTANDVKNYWNTHLQKKMVSPRKEVKENKTQTRMQGNIIKPRPRTFSKGLPWLREKSKILDNIQSNDNLGNSFRSTLLRPLDEIQWWESLIVDMEGDKVATSSTSGLREEPIGDFWEKEITPSINIGETFGEEGQSGWNEFSSDVGLWDTFIPE